MQEDRCLADWSLFRTIGVFLPISQIRDSAQVIACQGVTLVVIVTSEMMFKVHIYKLVYFQIFLSNTSFGVATRFTWII